jgi:NAD(P)-dependent dehydrogenase (short-subunit alcohol dehydrogenase family)
MRVAVITGGTRGLGLAVARSMGAAGWQTLLTYRNDEANARAAVASLTSAGITAEAVHLDSASSSASAELAAHPWLANAAGLVVVHNAAAPFAPMPVHLLAWDDFQAQLDVGLRGLLSLAAAAVPRMARIGGGVIAAVSTRAALGQPPKGFAGYLAAKQAMRSLIKSLAVEHRARGVRTLSVCPGYMSSSLTAGWNPALQQAAANEGATAVEAAGLEIARLVTSTGSDDVPGAGEDYAI